jgi:SAM-dependent methyltransferase
MERRASSPGDRDPIDWNEAWRVARARRTRRGDSETWNRRASSFAKNASTSGYTERMLELMSPEPGWTVLDVGCGAGTLAVPLARRVRSVTALDFSARMLELLGARCAEEGLRNVVPVLGSWEDDWGSLGIGTHDVALASRSLSVDDLRGALEKLDRTARLKVFVATTVGDGPVDRRVFEAVGREYVPGPDHRYPLNLLRQLGIPATVSFIPVAGARWYRSHDEAVESLAWMLPDPTPPELDRLRDWVGRVLRPGPDGLALPSPPPVSWAVISWSPGAIRERSLR